MNLDNDSVRELLRRMVLRSRDGFHESIKTFLQSAGYEVGWARVDGQRLVVYLGGQEPHPPPFAQALVDDIGGRLYVGDNQRDRGWYEWTWTAQV